eukprot:8647814-Pyramimonas_sp.AAC.1
MTAPSKHASRSGTGQLMRPSADSSLVLRRMASPCAPSRRPEEMSRFADSALPSSSAMPRR